MTERRTYEQLAAELSTVTHYVNSVVLHVKSGDEYLITSVNFREHDMALSLEYTPFQHDMSGKVKFSRTIEEMGFGSRFVFIGGLVK